MKFGDLLKSAAVEGKEKHVPTIETAPCCEGGIKVTVTVGKEVPHPNLPEHHIGWIQLYGVKESGQLVHLITSNLEPVQSCPTVTLCVKTEGLKSLVALEYCNLHGVWENSIDL